MSGYPTDFEGLHRFLNDHLRKDEEKVIAQIGTWIDEVERLRGYPDWVLAQKLSEAREQIPADLDPLITEIVRRLS